MIKIKIQIKIIYRLKKAWLNRDNPGFTFCSSFFFFISINQKDTCHTTNISKGGWFIRLFKKHLKLIKKNHIKWIHEEKINKNINIILT